MLEYDDRIIEILLEYVNIGMGKAAEVLNSILESHIVLKVPELKLIDLDNIFNELDIQNEDIVSLISMGYSGHIKGRVELLFSPDDASRLVNILTGEDMEKIDMDSLRSGTLCEIGNIVINGLMGTLSNLLDIHLVYTVPEFFEGMVLSMINRIKAKYPDNSMVLLAKTSFCIESLKIDGNIAVYFSLSSFNDLMDYLGRLMD